MGEKGGVWVEDGGERRSLGGRWGRKEEFGWKMGEKGVVWVKDGGERSSGVNAAH